MRWSQPLLAERLDASVEYVSLVERGERLPSLGMLLRCAKVLGVSLADLFSGQSPLAPADEATALLAAVPPSVRPVVLAMLRGVLTAYRKRKPKKRR